MEVVHLREQGTWRAPKEAREHVQLVLTDRSPLTRGKEYTVFAVKTWRLADLGARHAMLVAGLGWCSMPMFQSAAW